MPKIIPIPPKSDLEDLYTNQRLTTRQIGDLYGVSRAPVKNWLMYYNIPMRLSGRGLIAQGRNKPTPDELNKMVHEDFLTGQEIGDRYGTTKEAVYYWLKTYSIPLPLTYAERKGIVLPTPDEFIALYEDQKLSLKEIAEMHQTTRDVIATFCKKNGLNLRNSGFNGGKRYECENGYTVRSVYEQRVSNWLFQHGIDHSYEPPLPFDKRYKSDFLANGWYIEIWGVTKSPPYVKRRLHKIEMYKTFDLPLLQIHEHNFGYRRNEQWKTRLETVLHPPVTQATLL